MLSPSKYINLNNFPISGNKPGNAHSTWHTVYARSELLLGNKLYNSSWDPMAPFVLPSILAVSIFSRDLNFTLMHLRICPVLTHPVNNALPSTHTGTPGRADQVVGH